MKKKIVIIGFFLILIFLLFFYIKCSEQNSVISEKENLNNNENDIVSQLANSNNNDNIIENEIENYPSFWVMENLRLRENPNTDGNEILIMQRGTMVQQLDMGDEVTIDGIKNNWIFVQTENGEKGWCFGGYLADSKEKAIITGFWTDNLTESWALNKRYFVIFLRSNGRYGSGMLESSGQAGTWSYTGGNVIQINTIIDEYEAVNYSSDLVFTIIDNDRINFGKGEYRRMTPQDLQRFGIR